jgi:adenosine deaminase/aminodeoxyfutalosine deaminase
MAIDALPKAELHLHLEGSIRPDTAVKLAARHGVTLTPEEVAARYNFSNFNGFLDMFKWVTSFLRTPDDYALITRQLCEELVRQNVVYAEFTISAGVILRRMQNLEATVAAIREAAQSVPFARLRTAFILDAARQFGPDPAKEVARSAAKLQKLGVVSFGMAAMNWRIPRLTFARRLIWHGRTACTSCAMRGRLAGRIRCAKRLNCWERSESGMGLP